MALENSSFPGAEICSQKWGGDEVLMLIVEDQAHASFTVWDPMGPFKGPGGGPGKPMEASGFYVILSAKYCLNLFQYNTSSYK